MVTALFILVSAASILFFVAIKTTYLDDRIKMTLTVAFTTAVVGSYMLGVEYAISLFG